MNNMKEIIRVIQGDSPEKKERWIDSTNGWQNLTAMPDGYSKEVIDKIEEHTKNKVINFIKTMDSFDDRTNITLVKKGDKVWFYRKEEALERLICLFNKDCSSQYNLGQKAKESVDIVISIANKRGFIELKPWDSKNSPMFGVVELLKNYFLCSDNKNITELIFLAPKEYFEKYSAKANWAKFFEFINNANAQLEGRTTLKVKYIDLTKKDFDNAVEKFNSAMDIAKKSKWIEKKTSSYDERMTICLSKEKACFEEIKDKLIFKNFTKENYNKI